MKSECWHKQKDEAEAALQAIKERRERAGKGRQATKSEKKAFAAGALINKGPAALAAAGDDQYPNVSTSLRVYLVTSPHPAAFSATAALDERRVRHGSVGLEQPLQALAAVRAGHARHGEGGSAHFTTRGSEERPACVEAART